MARNLVNTISAGGGGDGALDVYYIEDMEGLSDVSKFSTGNNATFMGAGALAGTLFLNTASPISGTKSLSYTQAVGSLNDYFASEIISVDPKQQNNYSSMIFYFNYSGNDGDLKFVIWDETNGVEISSGVELVRKSTTSQRYAVSAYIPVTCNDIRWGAQVLTENSGAKLVVDDVEITSNPFAYPTFESVFKKSVEIDLAGSGDFTGGIIRVTRNGDDVSITSVGDLTHTSSTSPITAVGLLPDWATPDTRATNTYVSGANIHNAIALNNGALRFLYYDSTHSAVARTTTSNEVTLSYNLNDANSTPDTIAAVGTTDFKTVTKTLSTNVTTTGVMSDLTFNNLEVGALYLIVYHPYCERTTTATSNKFCFSVIEDGAGTVIAESKVTSGSVEEVRFTSPVVRLHKAANGEIRFNAIALTNMRINTGVSYAQIIKLPDTANILAKIPTPKTAYIKDVKPSGTAGGTFTAGAWQTRVLNTLEGDTGFVSLSGNQFTLQSGKYEIEASAPSYVVDRHKGKLRNITDSIDLIIGTTEYNSSAISPGVMTHSFIKGQINITKNTTFEIQHYANTNGSFGIAASFGVDEVYTQLKITKVE